MVSCLVSVTTFFRIIISLCIAGQILCFTVEKLDSVGSVVFVSVLFRHGDRTPIRPYPTDPYKNLSYWPTNWGQLTNEGKRKQLDLGQWLRKRYKHLVGDKFSTKNIYILSTDVDRTLMSAECNLAGLYPPEGKEVWSDLKWQPTPVHTIPETMDKLLAMKAPCPKYEEEKQLAKKSAPVVEINEKYKELYAYLSNHSGMQVSSVETVNEIYSALFIENLNNFTLPNWTKEVFPVPMKSVSAFSFTVPTLTSVLKRLKSGPLIKNILEHMQKKKDGSLKPDRNMWIYSAHDTTVANLLNTLGIFELHVPPFAATVLVELRRSANRKYFVTVLYKNETEKVHLMKIPGCEEACPLNDFARLVSPVLPNDWDEECHSHQLFDFTPDLPYNSLAVFAMVTSTLVVFLLLASASLYWYKQSPTNLYRKLATETL